MYILETVWGGLPAMLSDPLATPKEQPSLVLLYRRDAKTPVEILAPDGHDLLALKLILQNVTSGQAVAEPVVIIGLIDSILEGAVDKGLLRPPLPFSATQVSLPGALPTLNFPGSPPLPCSGTWPRPPTSTAATVMIALHEPR